MHDDQGCFIETIIKDTHTTIHVCRFLCIKLLLNYKKKKKTHKCGKKEKKIKMIPK
jgi:hypothetical protein